MEISALDLCLKVWSWLLKVSRQPPSPQKFQLWTYVWKFEVNFWKSVTNPPPRNFSSGLMFESLKLTFESQSPTPPPHPSHKWKFQLWTYVWKFEVNFWKSVTNPPRNFSSGLMFESLKLTFESQLPTLPPPTLPINGNFSSGLMFESLKLTFESQSPTPPEISALDLCLKVWSWLLKVSCQLSPPPPFP